MSSPLEPITPHPGSFDLRAMARGEPGVPRRFRWRDTDYVVVDIVGSTSEVEPHEGYVRRHVFEVRTDDGSTFRLVGERSTRTRRTPRWWVREVQAPADDKSATD